MCDTQVIIKDGNVFFAKNSNREPHEKQLVVRIPSVNNDKEKKLKTTYIEIDQVKNRFGIIISKPFWIWGAEMGCNEKGLVIGNTAVFTKVQERETGLIGMDLLRLALERADSAKNAIEVITSLISKYGQGGICGHKNKLLRYDNSFMIADKEEAWVLETANRHWVAKKVHNFAYTSNILSIGTEFDMKSKGLEDFAKKKGLFSGKGYFNFSKTFNTWFIPYIIKSKNRERNSLRCLLNLCKSEDIGIYNLFNNLRYHNIYSIKQRDRNNADICAHAGGPIRCSQTCGSMVSKINEKGSVHFFTGTSAPCLSIFKPVNFDYLQDFFVLYSKQQELENSLWVKHEKIHRKLLMDKEHYHRFIEDRDKKESSMLSCIEDKMDYEKSDKIVSDWQNYWNNFFGKVPFKYSKFSFYGRYWNKINFLDGVL